MRFAVVIVAVGVLAVGVLAGCDRASAILICNNANCAPPVDLAQDNTIEALRSSLALQWEARPAIDGIEIDTVWDADASRCLFTSDFSTALGACDAIDAADAIVDHLRGSTATTRFYVKIHAKPLVAPSGRAHTPAERTDHVDCDLGLAELVETAATEVDRPLTILFGEDSASLRTLLQHPRWTGHHRGERLERRFVYPLTENTGGEDLPPDIVSFDWTSLHDGEYTAIRDVRKDGVNLQLWARQVTVQALWAIDYIQPEFVDTNDVMIVREFLGPTRE